MENTELVETVYIVDDDEAVRRSMELLVRSMKMRVESFESAKAFLDVVDEDSAGCLILDIRMPGMSGLELQQTMHNQHLELPIIFVTGHGNVPMAVQAMRRGAIDFLEKPFNDQDLLDRINQALEIDRAHRETRSFARALRERTSALTPREREVMDHIVAGRSNKVIAAELNLSERTVEIHRSKVMAKMRVRSLAELVTMVTKMRSGSA